MTESIPADHPQSSPEPRPITPTIDVHQRPDVHLVELASFVDFLGFPLTLYMPWGIASGNTAAPRDYYRHLADSVRNTIFPNDLDPKWQELIDEFAQRTFGRWADLEPSERTANLFYDGVNLTAALILRNAKCWIGGLPRPLEHEYLRVRLTDVTAWSWGGLTT